MPPRRKDTDDDKPDSPSLLPSDDAPFGPPPKEKRRLFGRKKDAGDKGSGASSGLSADAPTEPEPKGRRRGKDKPDVEDELELVVAPDDEPAPPKRRSPRGAVPPAPRRSEPPPPPPPPPTARPTVAPEPRSFVPNPDEHEIEFVFSGAAGSPSKQKAAPALVVEETVVSDAGPAAARGGPSRGAIIAIAVLLLLVAGVGAYALLSGGDDPEPTIAPPTDAATTEPTTSPTAEPTATPLVLPEECVNGFGFAQAHPDDAIARSRTGDLCPTTELWLEGAKRHPGAIGVEKAGDVGNDDLVTFCSASPDTRVCEDASAKGLLVTPTPTAASSPAPTTATAAPTGQDASA